MLKNRNILLGVSGGIAVYKAAALTSKLVQAGANVKVIMTKSACEFVSPLTFKRFRAMKYIPIRSKNRIPVSSPISMPQIGRIW